MLKVETPSTNAHKPSEIQTLGEVESWRNRGIRSVVKNEPQNLTVGGLQKADH